MAELKSGNAQAFVLEEPEVAAPKEYGAESEIVEVADSIRSISGTPNSRKRSRVILTDDDSEDEAPNESPIIKTYAFKEYSPSPVYSYGSNSKEASSEPSEMKPGSIYNLDGYDSDYYNNELQEFVNKNASKEPKELKEAPKPVEEDGKFETNSSSEEPEGDYIASTVISKHIELESEGYSDYEEEHQADHLFEESDEYSFDEDGDPDELITSRSAHEGCIIEDDEMDMESEEEADPIINNIEVEESQTVTFENGASPVSYESQESIQSETTSLSPYQHICGAESQDFIEEELDTEAQEHTEEHSTSTDGQTIKRGVCIKKVPKSSILLHDESATVATVKELEHDETEEIEPPSKKRKIHVKHIEEAKPAASFKQNLISGAIGVAIGSLVTFFGLAFTSPEDITSISSVD